MSNNEYTCRKKGCNAKCKKPSALCSKHAGQCLIKDCEKKYSRKGLCAAHGGRYYTLKKDKKMGECRKDGCSNISPNVLCDKHTGLCSQKDCTKKFQYLGLCFRHGGRRPKSGDTNRTHTDTQYSSIVTKCTPSDT